MPRMRHKAEEIVAKLRQVEVLSGQGQSVAEAIRSIGVTEVTYYRWRSLSFIRWITNAIKPIQLDYCSHV